MDWFTSLAKSSYLIMRLFADLGDVGLFQDKLYINKSISCLKWLKVHNNKEYINTQQSWYT